MEKSYFKCFRLFLETGKKITDVKLKAQYYESLLEYGLDGIKPNDPIVDALLTSAMYSIDRSDEIKEQKSEYMRGNSNASKNWENISKQRKTETNRDKQTKTHEEKKNIEDIEDKEDKKNKEDNKKEKILKKKFLEFVFLTDDEYSKLKERFGTLGADERIERLNNYIGSIGKDKYKSHYHTILSWYNKEDKPHKTNVDRELQMQRHREQIEEQIKSFTSQPKQNAETGNETGGYNWRTNIGFSEIPG